MTDATFKTTSKLSLRLMKYFTIILTIILILLITWVKIMEHSLIKSQAILAKAHDIDKIITLSTEMQTSLENYYTNPLPKYARNFNTLASEVYTLTSCLQKDNPDNYMYRDISAFLDSFHTVAASIFAKIDVGIPSFYCHNLLSQASKLNTYVREQCYLTLSSEIRTAEMLSFNAYTVLEESIKWIYGIILFMALLCLYFAYHFSKNIAKPIHALSSSLQAVAQGNFDLSLSHLEKDNEINILIQSFNQMVVGLKERSILENALKEERLKTIEMQNLLNLSQLEYLRMQINPHFLFNALNGIHTLAIIENNPRVASMLNHLVDLIRYTLNKNNSYVPLSQELDLIKSYLVLQQMRFGNRLTYKITVPDTLSNFLVPPMILQPLVENAIIHGLEPLVSGGNIYISATSESDSISLSVSDNGTGMSSATVSRLLDDSSSSEFTSQHIGFANVRRRLKLLYGYDAITIESEPDIGTTILLNLRPTH